MNPFVILFLAIVFEVIATTSLKASEGFTRLLPSVVVVVGYAVAFYLLSQALKTIPIGTTYAIWSGVGTAVTVMIGVVLYREGIDLPRIIGIGLIILGVLVLNLFTSTSAPV
jgi:small multidrug resistance pump